VPDRVDAVGYVAPLPIGRGNPETSPAHLNRLRWIDRQAVERLIGSPISPYEVVLVGDSASANRAPERAANGEAGVSRVPIPNGVPVLDEGPHLSYAIQWFSFAILAIIGAVVGVRLDTHRQTT
jgi:cytochrome oxidase assembly protein ShyY1